MIKPHPISAVERWKEDRDLAARCALGDRVGQRLLYEREKRRVHATLYRIFGTNRQIEDTLQEVFLQVFRSLDGFRGESSLSTWIHRMTVRVAFAHLTRTRARRPELELVHDVASDAPSPESALQARDATRRLYAILDDLDATHRLAFVLHELEGHSLAEVASLMEASLVATKSRVARTRSRLFEAARKDPVLASFVFEDDMDPSVSNADETASESEASE